MSATIASSNPNAVAIRANIAIVEPDGTTTKVNEPGPTLTPDDLEAAHRVIVALTGAMKAFRDGEP